MPGRRRRHGRRALSNTARVRIPAEKCCSRISRERAGGCIVDTGDACPVPVRQSGAAQSAPTTESVALVTARCASNCAALVRSRAFLGRGMEVAGLPVIFLGLAFGRLPLPSLGPGFRPQGLFLGFRELPLAPLETVVRFPGQLTFSAMLNGARGGRQPPRLWTSGRA